MSFDRGLEILQRLAVCEPSLEIQVLETLLLAGVMIILFPPLERASLRYFKSRPWYDFTSQLIKEINEKVMGISVNEALLDKCMGQMSTIPAQHFLGGVLCVPAIFGCCVSRDTALCLVRHGALVELGWEVQDTALRLWSRVTTEEGAKINPRAIFMFMFMHHAMQWALVIPMNLHYSHLSGYHELVFMLEGAAGFAGAAMFYGYTCDTSDRDQLRRMILCNGLNFLVMVYTRLIHYWWSVFKCLRYFWQVSAYPELVAGIICGGFLMPFIGLTFIPELWHKLRKFVAMYMKPEPEIVAATLLESKARQSVKGKMHAE